MGGGGGGSYTGRQAKTLAGLVRKEAEKSASQFELELAAYLSNLLAVYNARDTSLVSRRLEQAKEAIEDELETSFDQLFGGSVAKHTYVDGLSDIDTLLVVSDPEFQDLRPAAILDKITNILRERLPAGVTVDHGRMAVSVTYEDGMTIQMLPALRTQEGLKVPSANKGGWSEIDPDGFRNALTNVNNECGGKLVPTIKLAKAVIANMPDQYRLSGYHVESIAIAAFRNYKGSKTTEAMLPFLFERAKELVLTPIRDSTEQSVHVDGYLGGENNERRRNVSHLLGNLAKRMRNASAANSKPQWKAVFFTE
jgi:hypothetical protein